MRLLAVVEYDGTDFAGFQYQSRHGHEARTIQLELERAIATCTGETLRVNAAGRTDAGVHARGQVIHWDTESPMARTLPTLLRALNGNLPVDVKVRTIQHAPDDFHARYSATRRRYAYRVYASVTPSPLHRRYAHAVRARLDVARMNEGAQHLVGAHDFIAFAAEEGRGPTIRRIFRADVAQTWAESAPIWHTLGVRPPDSAAHAASPAQLVEIEVEATGFLRHMMRRIAGTLIRVGDGRLAPDDVASILQSKEKALAGPTAPARGLCLEQVTYQES